MFSIVSCAASYTCQLAIARSPVNLQRRSFFWCWNALSHAVAAIAREKGYEGDPIMAHAAKLAAKNLAHRNGIGSGLGQEWPGMAVGTVEPKRMGLMRKKNMGHFLGVLHHDIQIEDVHFFSRGESCAR